MQIKELLRGELSLPETFWRYATTLALGILAVSYGWGFVQLVLVLFLDPSVSQSIMHLSAALQMLMTLIYLVTIPKSVWRSAQYYDGRPLWGLLAKLGTSLFVIILCLSAAAPIFVLGVEKFNWGTHNAGAAHSPAATLGVAPQSTDVQLIGTVNFAVEADESITTATALPEGGFFAVTTGRGGHAFAYTISKAGTVTWRRKLPSGVRANASGISRDGSYWIAGTFMRMANEPNVTVVSGLRDFLERIELDGETSPPIEVSENNKVKTFHCAVKSGNDYIQTDADSSRDEYLHLRVPRVSMIDSSGAPLWERWFGFDRGRRIVRDNSTFSNPIDQLFDCAGILVMNDERILAAQRVVVLPDLKTDEEVFQYMTAGYPRAARSTSATLLVALDLQGNVVASVRHENSAAGLLVNSPRGALLFETTHHQPGTPNFTTAGQFLHLYTFDANLRELKPAITLRDSNYDTVNAAFSTPEGGLLIKACPGEDLDRHGYLRYISSSGAISPKRPLETLGFVCGGVFSFSPGPNPGEGLMLVQTPQNGNRLLTLRYSN